MERVLEPEIMADEIKAEAYDRLVSDEQGEMLDTCFALSVLDAAPREGLILDLGVGTGRIPIKVRHFSNRHTIVAVDISPSMLKLASQNIHKEKSENIHCVSADMKRLPCPDATVNMVISHVAMHHLANPIQMLKEVGRVLKPNGAAVKKYVLTHVGIERKASGATPGPHAHFKGLKWAMLNRSYRK